MIQIERVLVATDFSDPSEAAVRYGKNLARQCSASLHLVHVVTDVNLKVEATAHHKLEGLVSADERRALYVEMVVLESGTPGPAILSYAKDARIDLIVAGTHGQSNAAHFSLGGVAQRLVRGAPCPVLTVRSGSPAT